MGVINSVRGEIGMELPLDCSSRAALQELHDQFDFAHTILEHSVSKNVAAFTFAGLRVPAIVRDVLPIDELSRADFSPLEVVFFQDHLHDRIVMLARNNQMLREIWSFNECTRSFREFELSAPATANVAVGLTADLVSALRSMSKQKTIEALRRSLAWRTEQLETLLTGKSAAV